MILKYLILKIKKIRLWYQTVIKEHNNVKLGLTHKIRAIFYGFSSDFYKMYNLEKNNPKFYISEYKRLLSRNINSKYMLLFDNKIIFEKIFSNFVNVPRNVIIILDDLYDYNGNIITKDKLSDVLKNEKYILKPASDTGGGAGLKLLSIKDNHIQFDGSCLNFDKLYDELLKFNGCIICDFINQNEYSKKINPDSVNTIRIITLKDPYTNKFIIPCAVHRFGSKKSGFVDNVSSGGYVSLIDISTGVLDKTAYGFDPKFVDYHPDTKALIKGVKIPNWDNIKCKILATANNFPYIPFIAWDIVVTDEGFSVIEINASTSLELFQVFGSIKDTELGNFYKYYGFLK